MADCNVNLLVTFGNKTALTDFLCACNLAAVMAEDDPYREDYQALHRWLDSAFNGLCIGSREALEYAGRVEPSVN